MSIIGIFSLNNPNHKRNEALIFGSLLTALATIAVGLTTVALGKKSLHLNKIIVITGGAGGAGLALTGGVAWAFRRRTDQETGASGTPKKSNTNTADTPPTNNKSDSQSNKNQLFILSGADKNNHNSPLSSANNLESGVNGTLKKSNKNTSNQNLVAKTPTHSLGHLQSSSSSPSKKSMASIDKQKSSSSSGDSLQRTANSNFTGDLTHSPSKDISCVSTLNNGDVLVIDNIKVEVKEKIDSGADGLIFSCVNVDKKDLILKLAWNGDNNSRRKESEYLQSVRHEYKMMKRASQFKCAIPALDPIAIDGKGILMPKMDGNLFLLMMKNRLSSRQLRRVTTDLIQSIIHHHNEGIIHGDLTFGNILYRLDKKSGYEFRLSDYADAKQSTSNADRASDFGCLARGLVHLLTWSTNEFTQILAPLQRISELEKENNYEEQLTIAYNFIKTLN